MLVLDNDVGRDDEGAFWCCDLGAVITDPQDRAFPFGEDLLELGDEFAFVVLGDSCHGLRLTNL